MWRTPVEHARGGEIYVHKAPACTVKDLAQAMCVRFSKLGKRHPVREIGIRVGEKIHEVLVNEYELPRALAHPPYFSIQPEYRATAASRARMARMVTTEGEEFTSANTVQLKGSSEIGRLLDLMGDVEA